MTELFLEADQYRRIAGATSDAMAARQGVESQALRISDLERRVDRLGLVCQALWELLSEKTGLTEEEVYARMQEVDLRDGKADGKISRQVTACPHCQRPVSSRRNVCLYCGAEFSPSQLIG